MVFGPSVGNNRSGGLLGLIASWLKQRFTGGNMFNKKKAFTLSELLVVVIVLGVLAAVAVPKFTRVLETRKTTEAEGMLSAVRTEQEKRCTLGDEYSVKFASLPVAASLQRSTEREAKSANYTYTLNGSGMQAQSSGKDYTIKMLSYKDGGLCCEGSYCNQLNKSYPSCGGVPADECAVRIPCSGSSSRSCGCQNTGRQYRSCDENTGSWGAWGSCSVGACKSCSGAATRSCGCNNAGTQRRTCNVFTGTWGGWSSCSVGECKDCVGSATESCGCNNAGVRYRTCNEMTGTWGSWGACSIGECKSCSGPSEQSCGCNNAGTQSRTCNEMTGTWGSWGACSIGECQGCSESSKPATSESCGCNNGGTRTRSVTCDQMTGTWNIGSWGACSIGECQGCSESSKPATSESCGCNNSGTRTRSVTCDQMTGTWDIGSWGACSVADCQECSASDKPTDTQSCGCNGEGTQTRSVTCDQMSGTWSTGSWGACSIGECKACSASDEPSNTQSCGCNGEGTQTRSVTCDPMTGTWKTGSWGACSIGECKTCSASKKPIDTQMCGKCGMQKRSVTCDQMTGTWKTGSWGACSGETGECVPGTREDGDCPAPYVGGPSQRICSDSCQWSAWDMRYCKEPDPCDTDPNGEACCRSKPECHWNSSKRYCDCQGGSSGGSSCTWRTVRTYSCGTNVPASACAGYSKCSINDYCPGGGIRVEACL